MSADTPRLDVFFFAGAADRCRTCAEGCPSCEGGLFELESVRVYADGSVRLYHACSACGASIMARDPSPEEVRAHGVVAEGPR